MDVHIHLNIQFADHPLAENFDILLGTYDVRVPSVEPGEYQIVGKRYPAVSSRMSVNPLLVMGDSGNTGQPFQIVA